MHIHTKHQDVGLFTKEIHPIHISQRIRLLLSKVSFRNLHVQTSKYRGGGLKESLSISLF